MSPRRAFIRTLWGDPSIPRSQTKVRRDVRRALARQPRVECVDLAFGPGNQQFLRSQGLEPRQIHSQDLVWPEHQLWRHKLEAWRIALGEFDEIVFLDWDIRLTSEVPDSFWDVLSQKAPLQACLARYMRLQAPWRTDGNRCVPNAAFVYIRGLDVAEELIRLWDTGKYPREEICMAAFNDNALGGWKGLDAYFDHFEPLVCRMTRRMAIPPELEERKSPCFRVPH